MATAERIDIEVGGKSYNVSTTSILYFAAHTDFHQRSGQAATRHDEIPQFEAAYEGIQNGFRYCFRKLGTDLTEYHALDLKTGKGEYQTDYKKALFVKANKATARDSSFRLLYLILTAEFEDESKTRQKIYNAVLFVISHRAIFKYHARKTIREAYEERFYVSEKQKASLDRWPVLVPGTDATWSDHDVTTEDSSGFETDPDDF